MSAPVPPVPTALPPEQVLANAHLLRTQHGWNQSDTDGYVQEQTGLPGMVALASAISQRPTVDEGPPGALWSGASAFGRGASFNFADRLSGGVDALLAALKHGATDPATLALAAAQHPDIGQAYAGGRDEARQYYAAADQAHPVLDKVANAAGNVASTLAGGAALKAPATLLGAGLQGAGIGAGSAGLATLGNQQDLTDPSAYLNAGKAAGVGGAIGFPLGLAGGFLAQRFFGRSGALLQDAVKKSGGPEALQDAAAAQDAAGRGVAAGGVPADLSPELQGLANPAVNAAQPAVRAPLQEAILARNAGQPQRLAEDLRDLFGADLNGPKRVGELQAMVRTIENDPVTGYQALNEAVGPIQDPRLDEILGRPGVRAAFYRAVDNLRTAGEDVTARAPNTGASGPLPPAGFEPTAAGSAAVPPGVPDEGATIVPNFQTVNGTRKTLAQMADAAYRAGNGDQGAAYSTAANELRGILADNVPPFEDLQGRVANVKSMLDAANDAGDVLTNETLHGLADKVNGLSGDALTEFRRGLASKLYDQLASMRTGRGIAGTLLTDPGLQAKLQVAFGDQQTFARFMQRVGAEKAWNGTGAIFGNSQTAPRMAAAADWSSNLPVSGGLSLSPEGAHPYFFAHALKGNPATTANPLARALLTPSSVDQFLQTIQALQQRGVGLQRGLTALPGMAASPLTQP